MSRAIDVNVCSTAGVEVAGKYVNPAGSGGQSCRTKLEADLKRSGKLSKVDATWLGEMAAALSPILVGETASTSAVIGTRSCTV